MIDYQALMDIAKVVESVPEEKFQMDEWFNKCGTAGCMVGWWVTHRPDDVLKLVERTMDLGNWGEVKCIQPQIGDERGFEALQVRFGLTEVEAEFLFSNQFSMDDFYGFGRLIIQEPHYHDRTAMTKAQNIARLRKFIYWRLRKSEIFADYEKARHQEGDWNVAQSVLELVGV